MSSPRPPRLGSVAWAELVDANGFGKVRPVVIVTPTAEIAHGRTVRVVAITTRLPATLPDDHICCCPGLRVCLGDELVAYPMA